MDRRLEVEQLRRSIAMLRHGARDGVGREDARQPAQRGPAATTI
jgi:hypothetical protein